MAWRVSPLAPVVEVAASAAACGGVMAFGSILNAVLRRWARSGVLAFACPVGKKCLCYREVRTGVSNVVDRLATPTEAPAADPAA